MSSRFLKEFAAALVGGAVLACALVTDVRGDDEVSPSPGSPGARSPFVSSAPGGAEIDPMIQLAPNGEHDSRVGAILAAHPDRDVTICLAGCGGGGPKVVTIRQSGIPATIMVAAEAGGQSSERRLRPSAGKLHAPEVSARTAANSADKMKPVIGDVICVAGCIGAPGEVVQEGVRLTWIDPSANHELRNALRGLAERLIAQEAEAAQRIARDGAGGRHAWMSDEARRMLVEPALPSVLAALVRSATAMVERAPLR